MAESRETARAGGPYTVLGVHEHLVAIPSSRVEEMFLLREVAQAPGAPPWQRGVTSLRGRVLPVLDLRVALGIPPAREELAAFLKLLDDREQDHLRWLAELEASVREARTFGLTTDPRRCKFGVWYYAYRASDAVVESELARFEQPHAAIHAVAIEVEALRARGDAAGALRLVEEARAGVLGELVRLFARTREAVRAQHREIGVVVAREGGAVVLAADTAEAVAPLDLHDDASDPVRSGALRAGGVARLARWRARERPVLVLDLEQAIAAQ
jgi:chemotaxis signal transduction protein